MRGGWVAVHRKTLDSWVWKLTPTQYKVFHYLLMRANWKATKMPYGDSFVDIPEGSLVDSERTIAKNCGVGRKPVQSLLKKLQEEGTIQVTKRFQRLRFITFCNWERYQDPEGYDGTNEGTNKGTNEGTNEGTYQNNVTRKQGNQKISPAMQTDIDWLRENIGGINGTYRNARLAEWLAGVQKVAIKKRLDWQEVLLSASAHPSRAKKKDFLRYYTNWVNRQRAESDDFLKDLEKFNR